MKITRKLLNRVEGEVELKLLWDKGVVKDAYVIAPNFRGFEKLLEGRPYLDSLVITPRVCGICGHAHLIATTKAIENAYQEAGIKLKLTKKATTIRTITLLSEILQNHIKWFYLYLMPDFIKLKDSIRKDYEPLKGRLWQKALEASNYATKIIAVFGGQWPHTSYSLPGGVMCDPTHSEIAQATGFINKVIKFMEEDAFGVSRESFEKLKPKTYIASLEGSIALFAELCQEHGLHLLGNSYKRFLAGGKVEPCFEAGTFFKRKCEFDISKVRELEGYSFFSKGEKGYTWAKAVRYKGLPYETGPLARQIVSDNLVIRHLFKEYEDSVMLRVLARMDEAFRISLHIEKLLHSLELSEPSWIEPPIDNKRFSGKGVGAVEAARGTLIHEIEIERGRIKSFNIITPTTWNMGPRDDGNLGVVEKALLDLDSEEKAHIVLRSFDVCSVCTTH